jgi:hypothetical protein
MKAKSSGRSLYGVHPGVVMVQDWIAELPEKTGRSLEQWIALVEKEGPAGESERVAWLKKKHGHGTNSAMWIAQRAEGRGTELDDPAKYLAAADRYVEEMYGGKKTALRPIYDELLKLGLSMGPDVKACPCKTIVPLYRKHVFAQLKPTTQTRVDLGLALGKTKAGRRLVDTGGLAKGDRITHRIEITSPGEIDAEVKKWLKTAYEMDA